MKRYEIIDGSQSNHCCFRYTVVDMTKPLMIGGRHWENRYEQICECLNIEYAKRIVSALNATELQH